MLLMDIIRYIKKKKDHVSIAKFKFCSNVDENQAAFQETAGQLERRSGPAALRRVCLNPLFSFSRLEH